MQLSAAGGGANLAFACDLVLAAEETTFGEVFRHVGLVTDTGGSYLVPKDVGLHRAKELFYTGRTFDASTAEEFGLINYAVPKEEFEDRCTALIEEVATGPTRSFALLKQLLHDAVDSDLETMLAAEADAQAIAYETEDHRRGVQALLDGVEPSFRGE